MNFNFYEIPDSRTQSEDPPSIELKYKASGEFDDKVVASIAKLKMPDKFSTAFGTLYRGPIRIEPNGWSQYICTASYEGGQKRDGSGEDGSGGSYTISFDTTGATVKIKAAKQHIATYEIPPTPPDPPAEGGEEAAAAAWPGGTPLAYNPHNGAIGVKRDGEVEGTDIVVPALKFTINFRHKIGLDMLDHMCNLSDATGFTNADLFLNKFQPGELLFLGAVGSQTTSVSETEEEIGYQFIRSKNATLSMAGIKGIVKKGHYLAWIEFEDEVREGEGVVQPKRVHIERVYDSISFVDAFGWG